MIYSKKLEELIEQKKAHEFRLTVDYGNRIYKVGASFRDPPLAVADSNGEAELITDSFNLVGEMARELLELRKTVENLG